METEKEDRLLLASLEDKWQNCRDRSMVTQSHFLDMRQRSLAEAHLRSIHARYMSYGGYDDAERRILLFLPDYADEDTALDYETPLALLRVTLPKGGKPLTHRDYLGSLMALGIKREILGDILVTEDGADIPVLEEMSDFLLSNYSRAGRAEFTASLLPIGEIRTAEQKIRLVKDSVASLRLDSLIASAFDLSRGKAQEAIAKGLVYVNGAQTLKSDRPVEEGDKLVLRGKGKVRLSAVGGESRKGRTYVEMERYL